MQDAAGSIHTLTARAELWRGEATLAFYLARKHWGHGLASEAAAAFVEFGWKELRLSRIVATVQVENGASVRILEKLGFELLATEKGARSFFRFALLRPEPLKLEFLG